MTNNDFVNQLDLDVSADKRVRDNVPVLSCEPFHAPVADDHEERIAIMAERWERGLNIFTGARLTEHERLSVSDDE